MKIINNYIHQKTSRSKISTIKNLPSNTIQQVRPVEPENRFLKNLKPKFTFALHPIKTQPYRFQKYFAISHQTSVDFPSPRFSDLTRATRAFPRRERAPFAHCIMHFSVCTRGRVWEGAFRISGGAKMYFE